MPYYKTSDEWLAQSQLLLEARPTTTRVTTKYAIKPAGPRRKKSADKAASDEAKPAAADGGSSRPPRGALVLKTYDPTTGTTLKYRTTKAAEVSRLVLSLGRLGRPMAGLPPLKAADDAALLAAAEGQDSRAVTPAAVEDKAPLVAPPPPQQQQQAEQKTTVGGGKGKKKKGKR